VSKSITFSTHDRDGRLRLAEALEPGEYELSFHLQGHFGAGPHLSDRVSLQLRLEGQRHYHVPLLVSPFGFASYRGS
jgi:5-hydroxyisourate hydrolase